MASVTAFNDMLSQFLVELHKTFPDETGIKKMTTSFEMLKKTNPRIIVDGFMKGVTPYADKISAKDEKFILEEIEKIEMLKDLNIKSYWARMSPATKAATWQYLQTLYMLGTTITAIPAETLSLIEGIAKDCADKMQTEGGEIDQDALMKMMGSMLGGMGKK
ncbi:hypothetical protein OtV5_099c [Ostreococcus tauri virus OtV5]|uniref:Uncharacterized protein n=1 Tax=Ostreococcus tauri virus OtV5 TaxID=1785753 RepID=A9YW07_9PHYC|nr:hypothetical protein OtV5_099c [Ostreococcus tauri virus OtV5]YP_003212924.1 hypothetical protein OTV1_101 [Ostreococcus tauri virus 1]ABY27890.2 hypothetical protein OtV5_099c [Ostreococcus tauri virus OtV5]CAY39689.1 hypothetical protein OTV1_101 [Ostreococcus tauri virus 1]